jgi:hypothetical protein
MAGATAVFAVATAGMLAGWEPFATWYYSLAWWSYIMFADAWLLRRGRTSVILRNPQAPRLLFFSIAIWATFEITNFRLRNWYYVEIPSELAVRWFGYALAYATVLPGIFVTAELLEIFWRPPSSARSSALSPKLTRRLLWAGLLGSLLPWIWPLYFFPLIWLGPTAFLGALNFRLGGKGILRTIGERGPGKLYRLAGAGMICGLLWECWNFWSRSKWVYEIPFFDWAPIFEMPIAGFLGFPPFAVACYEMYVAAEKLLIGLAERPAARFAFWLLVAIYVGLAFWGIDVWTVRSFQS